MNYSDENWGFFVRNQAQTEKLLQSPQAQNAPQSVLKALRNGEKILCACNAKDTQWIPTGDTWEDYLQDAKPAAFDPSSSYAMVLDGISA